MMNGEHYLNPTDSTIEILPKDCSKCVYIDGLEAWKSYYLRAKSENDFGWSLYSPIVKGIPMSIPGSPLDIRVNPIICRTEFVNFRLYFFS